MKPNPTMAPFSIRNAPLLRRSLPKRPPQAPSLGRGGGCKRLFGKDAGDCITGAHYQFAGGSMFSLSYLRGQSGLAYLLIFPALLLGRAGTALGADGFISRSGRKAQPSG